MNTIKLLSKVIVSPTSNLNDIKWFLNANTTSVILEYEEELIDYMYYRFNANDYTSFNVPIYFISGGNDYITPVDIVESYYSKIQAPRKAMIIIKESGHTPFLDLPELFSKTVKELLENQ